MIMLSLKPTLLKNIFCFNITFLIYCWPEPWRSTPPSLKLMIRCFLLAGSLHVLSESLWPFVGLFEFYTLQAVNKLMKHFRKTKKQISLAYSIPFDESVVELQLHRMQECLREVVLNRPSKAAEILQQVEKDLHLLPPQHKNKMSLLGLLWNMQALLSRKQGNFCEASGCLQKAQRAYKKCAADNQLASTRIKLTGALILSDKEEHQQAKQIVRQATTMLKLRNRRLSNQRLKEAEVNMSIIAYIVYTLKDFLRQTESNSLLLEGYKLSLQTLGPSNKLTTAIKLIAEQNQLFIKPSRKRQSSEIQSSKGSFKYRISKSILPQNTKEKEIHRIYQEKVQNRVQTEGRQAWNQHEDKYFLQTLWRVKHLYNPPRASTEHSCVGGSELAYSSKLSNRRDSPLQMKAREVVLRGRTINKEALLGSSKEVCCSHNIQTAEIEVSSKIVEKIEQIPTKPLQFDARQCYSKNEGGQLKQADNKASIFKSQIVQGLQQVAQQDKECQLI